MEERYLYKALTLFISDKATTIRPSNDNDIRPRNGKFEHYRTYTGLDEQYLIDAAGKVTAWQFWMSWGGTTVFQVWRRTDTPGT